MSARHALIQFLFSQFYEVKPTQPRSKCRSSYGMKHEFENALFHGWEGRFYFSNSETKEALAHIPHFTEGPNYYFRVKPRFRIHWMEQNRHLTNRPYGERKDKWATYTQAREKLCQLQSEVFAATHDIPALYQKFIALVGHEGEVKAIPVSLPSLRLAVADASGSPSPRRSPQQTPQSSPAHSSLQDEPRPCSP